jgi:hypothetical protein
MKGLKAAILPNLGALMALGSLTPFLLEICFQRYAGLAGQMGYDLGDNLFPIRWKAPLELKRLKQNGEAEPSSASFIPQQGALLAGECPVLGEFVWMPVLLHRLQHSRRDYMRGRKS